MLMFESMIQMRGNGTASKPAGLLALVFALLLGLLLPFAQAADDFLEPDLAFKFSAKMADPKNVAVTFAIADGYYMYRERFAFTADGAKLGQPVLPAGKIKFDDTFKKDVETYRKSVTIRIPVEAAGSFVLKVTSQGCADKGLCYAPMESQLRLSTTGGSGLLDAARGALAGNAIDTPQTNMSLPDSGKAIPAAAAPASEPGRIESSLKSGKLLAIVPLFILLGLGLAFTPCVLPMVPILSFIIVGEGPQVKRRRGFVLAAAYSLGMALVYTALGVTAGLLGEGLSAALQQPWILASFGLAMAVLSLSMFDVYQLQMPASIQSRLGALSAQQSAGKLAGVFLMGALSALIVGPCVAAPLAAALVYISQTRDVVIGGSALFALAVGMSVPLLLVGLSAGTLLPRAGPWMTAVKRFFGVLMLALALWMVSPLIAPSLLMLGWAALGIGYGAWLLWGGAAGWAGKALGLIFALLGVLQLAGAATGGRDPLMPLAHLRNQDAVHQAFVRVRSVDELDAALANARGKTVMLDFYADWCVSCKEMERFTFTDPRVQARFSEMVLLQADVTANNADDKALLKRFGLFGPPGTLFFDSQGREVGGARVIGYRNADGFLAAIASAQH
jgi:thiol:disulfide interchange protein DsbD